MFFSRRRLANTVQVTVILSLAMLVQQTRAFSTSSGPSFLQSFVRGLVGIQVAPPQQIQVALKNPRTTLVDVRSQQEVEQTGKVALPKGNKKLGWVNAPSDTLMEETKASASLLPLNKEAPIILYCASGMRASKCKNLLEQRGYTTVLNAGGLADLEALLKDAK